MRSGEQEGPRRDGAELEELVRELERLGLDVTSPPPPAGAPEGRMYAPVLREEDLLKSPRPNSSPRPRR
jgi:hypothetical protein